MAPAELVFLSAVKGERLNGSVTRIGLIRLSNRLVPQELEGETLGAPVLGEIQDRDLSRWKEWHQPPVERRLRLAFPQGHPSPPSVMYDFNVTRPVACIPGLTAHLLGPTPPISIFPDYHNPQPTIDKAPSSDGIEEHRTLAPIPGSIADAPLMHSVVSALASESSRTDRTPSTSADHPLSLPTDNRRFAFDLLPSDTTTSPPITSRAIRSHIRGQGAASASIESVLEGERSTSQGVVDDASWLSLISNPRGAYRFTPSVG